MIGQGERPRTAGWRTVQSVDRRARGVGRLVYLHATLPAQFDAVIHIDRTHALEPLQRTAAAVPEVAETYPTAL